MNGKLKVAYHTISAAGVNDSIKFYLASRSKSKLLKSDCFENLSLRTMTHELLWDYVKVHLKEMRRKKLTKVTMLKASKQKKTSSKEGSVKMVPRTTLLLAKLEVSFFYESDKIKLHSAATFIKALEENFNLKLVIGKFGDNNIEMIVCIYNPSRGLFSELRGSSDKSVNDKILDWIILYLKSQQHYFKEKYPKKFTSICKLDPTKLETRLIQLNDDFINSTKENLEEELHAIEDQVEFEFNNAKFLLDFYINNEAKIDLIRDSEEYFFAERFAQKLIYDKNYLE